MEYSTYVFIGIIVILYIDYCVDRIRADRQATNMTATIDQQLLKEAPPHLTIQPSPSPILQMPEAADEFAISSTLLDTEPIQTSTIDIPPVNIGNDIYVDHPIIDGYVYDEFAEATRQLAEELVVLTRTDTLFDSDWFERVATAYNIDIDCVPSYFENEMSDAEIIREFEYCMLCVISQAEEEAMPSPVHHPQLLTAIADGIPTLRKLRAIGKSFGVPHNNLRKAELQERLLTALA